MDTIKITGTTPDDSKKKVKKDTTVKWETDLTVGSQQHLKVVLDPDYGTNVGIGKKNKIEVVLPLSFTEDLSAKGIYVYYSLFRVTETGGISVEDKIIDGSTSGPYLVIDDIGKPNGFCERHHHEHREEECEAPH